MGKVRVHELAKKLNLINQDLITKLKAKGISVRTHSSSVDEVESMKALGLIDGFNFNKINHPKTILRKRKKSIDIESLNDKKDIIEELKSPIKKDLSDVVQDNDASNVSHENNIDNLSKNIIKKIATKEESINLDSDKNNMELKKISELKLNNTNEDIPTKKEFKIKADNVIGVIDAEAIKSRLAQEGRIFKTKSSLKSSEKNIIKNKDKKINSNNNIDLASKKINDDNSSVGNKPNWKNVKKKNRNEFTYKSKKESSGGGYELWLSPGKKKRGSRKQSGKNQVITTAAAHKRVVELTGPITVNDFSHRMSIKSGQVVSKLISMGIMATVNQAIDVETASIVASEFDYDVKNVTFKETNLIVNEIDSVDSLELRAPIVTVMGHVDHGKTSILDVIKKSNIAKYEAGGITQHLGAYSVSTSHGNVTFLDTPGHEAFTAMRARGANITDIVILVVAADDGVMPQTIEAIEHAKIANIPIIVAINKIDSKNSNPDKVLQQLSERNIITEKWGGDVQVFEVSALKNLGLDNLLDGISMLSEILELKANPNKSANGFVIEAKLDKGRGSMATILIQAGTLRKGEYLVAGKCSGRVRAMYSSTEQELNEAGPSTPVQIIGLNGVPDAGDKFNIVKDEKVAKKIIEHRGQKNREKELMQTSKISLENFLQSTPDDKNIELKLIIKADAFGSAEALSTSLSNLSTDSVKINVVYSSVGTITANDVNLAVASGAIIIGFNSKADIRAQNIASHEKIDIRTYKVIYDAINEVKNSMLGLLDPIVEEVYLGRAEVRMIILVGKSKIAGSQIVDGKIVRSSKIKIKRKNEVIHIGNISSLKRFKDDVKEISSGYECGIILENFNDIEEGDILECFNIKK